MIFTYIYVCICEYVRAFHICPYKVAYVTYAPHIQRCIPKSLFLDENIHVRLLACLCVHAYVHWTLV